MSRKFLICTICCFLKLTSSISQGDSTTVKSYPFLFFDTYNKAYNMQLVNQNYLSIHNYLWDHKPEGTLPRLFFVFGHLFGMVYTHEAGHQNVLLSEGIGSYITPTWNTSGLAIVGGVMDNTLINLRDRNLPAYIRLHTGGLEADYGIIRKIKTDIAFNGANVKDIGPEYSTRIWASFFYLSSSAIKLYSIQESEDQLNNDIVGHDIWGYIKHINRPDAPFHRYIQFDELTADERAQLNRIAISSLLNLLGPGKVKFSVRGSKVSLGGSYLLTPFGDMFEQNIYIKKNTLKLQTDLRVYQNKYYQSFGFGISIFDKKISNNLNVNLAANYWSQPSGFSFKTKQFNAGGSFDILCKWMPKFTEGKFSIDAALHAKTEGFEPEEPFMSKGIFFRTGITFYQKFRKQ
ncbi:hypothetical protein [Aquirufa salirivi]|uniref:DUF5723 domain-containing protein n=1 Tax=Aquirufa salirivi TaxID=3104729 RepID=A0ABW8RQ63_9BACT